MNSHDELERYSRRTMSASLALLGFGLGGLLGMGLGIYLGLAFADLGVTL